MYVSGGVVDDPYSQNSGDVGRVFSSLIGGRSGCASVDYSDEIGLEADFPYFVCMSDWPEATENPEVSCRIIQSVRFNTCQLLLAVFYWPQCVSTARLLSQQSNGKFNKDQVVRVGGMCSMVIKPVTETFRVVWCGGGVLVLHWT